ncbi:MAG: dihydroorotase [Chloroflexi bacterium]|nr:dihydroorotase [Chloroflexota bacterium]
MSGEAILIQGARIIDPSRGLDRPGDLLVCDSLIASAGEPVDPASLPGGSRVVRAGRRWVACPGFIDLHCHLREPGHEHKETIATGTLAAARGGFTAVCCMPNTEPAIDSESMVEYVLRQARATGCVRVFPIGCITQGRQGKVLAGLRELAEAGAIAFSDDGNPVGDPHIMRMALQYTVGLGLPIINHCEDHSLSAGGVMNEGWVATRLGLRGYPAAAEEVMIARDIALAEMTGGRLHLAHISTAGAVDLVRQAKARGLAVTAEATPHHLTMNDAWVLGRRDGGAPSPQPLVLSAYDTRTKVNPPLRSPADAEALAAALVDGTIDIIATDHAPHAITDKLVTYEEAAFGISVLETALGSLMGLVHGGLVDLPTLVHRLTVGPSQVLGGRFDDLATLRPGTPADVVLFDPDEEWTVDVGQFASKGKNTPLDGCTLKGRVKLTMVQGRVVFDGMGGAI